MVFSSFFSRGNRELIDDLAIEIYVDESCKNGHNHLILGALEFKQSDSIRIFEGLAEIRGTYTEEIKWNKLSDAKHDNYKKWAEFVFGLLETNSAIVHLLSCDTGQFDHKTHNQGSGELGFSKLIYQLLLHRIGRVNSGRRPIYGYLDSRTTVHSPENLRKMLNAGLSKWHNIHSLPFRRLTFTNSKKCDVIQALDLFTGALGERLNQNAERQVKKDFSKYVFDRNLKLPFAKRMRHWEFQFATGSRSPRS